MNKDAILSCLDIEEFYRAHLDGITGQGKQRKALCCFHEDQTPSLSVDFETGLFNCFACGEKGSVIDFVMRLKGLAFKEALQYLADRAGLSTSAAGKRSAAKSKTPSRASQAAPGKQNNDQGKGNTFTLAAIKKRVLKGGYHFIRLHPYSAASPEYCKALYRDNEGNKQARFYSLTDKGKGLYCDKRAASPVLYNQKALSEDGAALICYVEGEKDVDTLTGLDFLSVTAGAVNDWRSEFAMHFKGRHVCIFPDNDAPGKKHAHTVGASLKTIAASVKILPLDGLPEKGDVSDWTEQRRKQGKTSEEIRAELQSLIDAVEPVAGLWLPLPEGWPYFIDDSGNLCRMYEKRDGKTLIQIPVMLSNFDAAITQEIVEDDGTENLKRLYVIEGRRGVIKLHPLEVVHSKYEALTWHRQWAAQTVIEPGTRAKDLVRHAVETRSASRSTRRVFIHTGWREIGGKKTFLTAAGAIGTHNVEIRLPEELKRYSIPANPENEAAAIKTSLNFLDIARHEVTYPLWLLSFIAPLTSTITPMFSGFLYGERDSFKTSLAVLALSHFGSFMNKVGLLNFNDTAGSILQKTFILKDVLTVIDDFHPSPNRYDADKMQALSQNIIRSAGNRTGRARLNSDSTPQARYYPRGMVLITAEKLPAVQSTRTRTLTMEIKRGDVNLERLSALQSQAPLLPYAMSSFIHWLRDHLDWIDEEKSQNIEKFRGSACKEHSHKLAEHIAFLQYTLLLTCNWLVDRKAITSEQASELYDESWNVLLNISRDHRQLIEEEDPVNRFTEILHALIYQGAVRITDRHNELSCMGHINGRPIGFYDENWLYLIPEALWREIEVRCRETGSTFPTDRTTLFKSLKHRGLTKTDQKDQTRLTCKVRIHNETKWYLQLKRESLSTTMGTAGTEEDYEE